MYAIRPMTLCLLVTAYCGLATMAQAQNPEEGDIGVGFSGGASAEASSGAAPTADAAGSGMATGPEVAPGYGSNGDDESSNATGDDGPSDHDGVVGTFGVGFFGVMDLPLNRVACAGAGGCQTLGTLSAPTIGMRYWLSELIGIEAAVGLGLDSNSGQTQNVVGMTTTTTTGKSSGFGFALHGGVPLALVDMGHFVFEVTPQLNLGLTSGTLSSPAGNIKSSGFLFQAGGTVGSEIHFGFIGIPQLSLQANVGLLLSYQSWSQDAPNNQSWSNSNVTVATLSGQDPWQIFIGNIHAIYYF